MLLTPHILVGALLGSKIQSPWLVFIIAFISHFILDAIPHREYEIRSLKKKKINKKFFIDLLQVLTDLTIGMGATIFFVWHTPYRNHALLGMIAAILPDGLTFIYWRTKMPMLKALTNFHCLTVHPKNNKNTPLIWGLGSQLIIVAIAVFFILSNI
jgi:hypothetical protein